MLNDTLEAKDQRLFAQYQDELIKNRLIDFDGILIRTRDLLQNVPDVRVTLQTRWQHLLVDEFQDLDPIQYTILRILTESHRSIFAVGDDDQSIFSWRGADPGIVQQFLQDFEIASPIILNTNCRSTVEIFESARRILPATQNNSRREIQAHRVTEHSVTAHRFANENEEARWIINDLLRDQATSQLKLGRYAILYRTHAIGRMLESEMIAAQIQCQLGRGHSIAEDEVVAQIVSSVQFILNPESDLEVVRFARCVLPANIVDLIQCERGEDFKSKIRSFARRSPGHSKSCWRLIFQIGNLESLGRTQPNLRSLINAIMALGVGKYRSPVEDIVDKLHDPADNLTAQRICQELIVLGTRAGRILLIPDRGWEVAVRYLLNQSLKNFAVEIYDPTQTVDENDLILARHEQNDKPLSERVIELGTAVMDSLRNLMAALQLYECRRLQKSFHEYVVFDTETTDDDTKTCEVIELAAVRVRGGVIVNQYHSMIRCTRSISPGASAIHGYTDADLKDKPTLEEIWPRFREFVGDSILVAHNAQQFDVPIIDRLTRSWNGLEGLTFYDSLILSRHLMIGGSHSQENLAHHFGIETGRSHHALDDCLCLAQVFEKLQELHQRSARVLCQGQWLDAYALILAVANSMPQEGVAMELYRKGARRALGRFSKALEYYQEQMTATFGMPSLAEVIERLGGAKLRDQLQQDTPAEDRFPDAYARMEELIAVSETGELLASIRGFLDRVALSRSSIEGCDPDRVALLTFHATKGLEFSRVYVIGVEDNQIPGKRALKDNLVHEILESRRLLYVAMTRAEDRLVLTACNLRDNEPTGGLQFLQELNLTIAEMQTL